MLGKLFINLSTLCYGPHDAFDILLLLVLSWRRYLVSLIMTAYVYWHRCHPKVRCMKLKCVNVGICKYCVLCVWHAWAHASERRDYRVSIVIKLTWAIQRNYRAAKIRHVNHKQTETKSETTATTSTVTTRSVRSMCKKALDSVQSRLYMCICAVIAAPRVARTYRVVWCAVGWKHRTWANAFLSVIYVHHK